MCGILYSTADIEGYNLTTKYSINRQINNREINDYHY